MSILFHFYLVINIISGLWVHKHQSPWCQLMFAGKFWCSSYSLMLIKSVNLLLGFARCPENDAKACSMPGNLMFEYSLIFSLLFRWTWKWKMPRNMDRNTTYCLWSIYKHYAICITIHNYYILLYCNYTKIKGKISSTTRGKVSDFAKFACTLMIFMHVKVK